MAIIVNDSEDIVWKVERAAPQPIAFWLDDPTTGEPMVRAASVTAVLKSGSTTLTKAVGGGISLGLPPSGYPQIANALVTLQLTTADLAPFKDGNYTTIKFLEGTGDPKVLLLKGRLDIG